MDLLQHPELFRDMSETDRSDWLTQRYAVLRHAMNLEHCIAPTKRIVLAALKETSHAAEFIPAHMRGDPDIIAAVLGHNDNSASRYLTWSVYTSLEKDPRWFANDYHIEWLKKYEQDTGETVFNSTDLQKCFKSRLPGGRRPQVQELLKQRYRHDTTVPASHKYMPHIFYSL